MSEQSRTVLILDNDDVARESFRYHFEGSDWRSLLAATAEQALDDIAALPQQIEKCNVQEEDSHE